MLLKLGDILLPVLATVLGALGTWLLLPQGHGMAKPKVAHRLGFALAAIAILCLAGLWTPPGVFLTSMFFYVFGIAAIIGGLLTITSKNPIYSALWFASVVLSTSGLFLLAGAQFLAAGTIIVYAGAIIVTFLFVIMLAQMEGRAVYDRMARSPRAATLTVYMLLFGILISLIALRESKPEHLRNNSESRLVPAWNLAAFRKLNPQTVHAAVIERSLTKTAALPPLDDQGHGIGTHVAGLGGTIYSDHLVTVELVGALLFVALVGAVAIAAPRPHVRPTTTN